MILLDSALRKRQAAGNPVRAAMVGAGFMGRGTALQVNSSVPDIELVAMPTGISKGRDKPMRKPEAIILLVFGEMYFRWMERVFVDVI